MSFIKSSFFLSMLGVAWVLAVGSGLGYVAKYEYTAGVAATNFVRWPVSSRIQPAADRANLIIFAHPKCPCTRASIGELNALLTQVAGKVQVHVLFLKPDGSAENWEKTDLWRSAAAIPGVKVIADKNGTEASRFHASTSGQSMLFDSAGRRLFSGGITLGRGHAGDNPGSDAIVSLLNTGKTEYHETPVFGCSLRTYGSRASGN